MNICLVGPGIMSIPPEGWGAVESLIWDYKYYIEKYGHDVSIINTPQKTEIIDQIHHNNYDFVHIHYDVFYDIIERLPPNIIALSSHYPYIDQKHKHVLDGYDKILNFIINSTPHIFCVSREDYEAFKNFGVHPTRLFLTPNGANDDLFVYNKECIYPNKSIYLGKIEKRKRQYLFQNIPDIDFIGKFQEGTSFNVNNNNYLGELKPKDKIFKNLTNYANLILLSDGENGCSLVIKEALICGLGIVVSEYASSELDVDLPFIDVIPESKIHDLSYIKNVIDENKYISINMRDSIREYGLKQFSWSQLVQSYLNIINKIIGGNQ